MPTPQEISAALAFANDEATSAQTASLGSTPAARNSAALSILAEVVQEHTDTPDAKAAATEALAGLLAYAIPPKARQQDGRHWTAAVGMRAVALMWVIRPSHFGGVSLDAVARQSGYSRQMLDRYAVRFSRHFGHVNGGQRISVQSDLFDRDEAPTRKESLNGTTLPAGSAREHNPSMN